MHRKPLSKKQSRKIFKKNTGVQRLNAINPRAMRGGRRI